MKLRAVKKGFGRLRIFQIAAVAMLVSSCSSADVYPTALLREDCKQNSVLVLGQASTTALYVDRSYLRILVKPLDESYGLDDVIAFMLTHGYSALETSNRDGAGNALFYDWPPARHADLVRVAVKPIGDPACKNFEYVKKYPAQAWPWLRGMGLQNSECIGVESISSDERSPIRILADEHVLGSQFNWMNWQSRLDVRVVDASQIPERTFARMTEHYGATGGGMAGRRHAFLCQGGDRQISVFAQAFGSSGNRAKAPALLEAPIASELTIDRAGDDELHGLKWVARPQTVWSSNIINPEGTVWVSWAPNQGDYRYRFDTFLGDRIVSTRISLPEKGMQDVTGLAQSRSGWVVVAAVNIRSAGAKRYLVEIDQTGRLTRIAALTERQYAMISD